MSVPQIPDAATSMRASPLPGLGFSISRSSILPTPRAVFTRAFNAWTSLWNKKLCIIECYGWNEKLIRNVGNLLAPLLHQEDIHGNLYLAHYEVMMPLGLQPPNVPRRLVEIAARRSSGGVPIVASVFARDQDAVIREAAGASLLAYPTLARSVRALNALAGRGVHLRQ